MWCSELPPRKTNVARSGFYAFFCSAQSSPGVFARVCVEQQTAKKRLETHLKWQIRWLKFCADRPTHVKKPRKKKLDTMGDGSEANASALKAFCGYQIRRVYAPNRLPEFTETFSPHSELEGAVSSGVYRILRVLGRFSPSPCPPVFL